MAVRFASKKYHPVKDLNAAAWNLLGIHTQYYNTRLHAGAFALPSYVEGLLKDVEPNVETFLGCDAAFEDAGIVLFGAPFDSTTSFRPGTRFASKAMRSESFGLETYSPYLDKDLTDCRIFDSGDLELCFGDAIWP